MKHSQESVTRDALRFNVLFRRAQLRLSQSALAERAGVSRPVVSDLECGRANATIDVLDRIATALETSVVDLLTKRAKPQDSAADLERRAADGPEAFVDSVAFLAALDEQTPGTASRYSNRGRKTTVHR